MRVVELIPSLSVGGAERVAALLAGRLRQRGQEVRLISLGPATGSFIEERLRREGVELRFLDKGPGLSPRVLPALARELRAFRPDLAHTHLHALKYLLAAWAPRPPRRVLHTLHNLAEHEAVAHDRAVTRLALRAGVRLVAIGEAVQASVRRLYGQPAAFVIQNGIPVADFAVDEARRRAARAAVGARDEELNLLFAGRFNEQKDPLSLIEALARPALRDRPWRLRMAGDGELRPAVEAAVRARGLQGRVELLGVRGDLPALMAASDALVLPSRYEGNPLVVLEALAAGLAVVATEVGCLPELVPTACGRLVPPGRPDALAQALADLDPQRARQLGRAGADRAAERYDLDIMAQAYERAFRLSLGSVSPGDPS